MAIGFGFSIPSQADPTAAGDRFRHTYEICELAESLGFAFGACGNHRFSPEQDDPSAPFTFLSAVAARTSTIALASTVLVLPLYHPIDVAEQVATLDEVSGGRAILGVGVGYRPYEYDKIGLDYHRRGARMDEALVVVRAAWRDEPLVFQGEHFRFEGVDVLPKPVQRPGPPIWIGAQQSRGIERAAHAGDAWIIGFGEPLIELERAVHRFRTTAAGLGRAPHVCLMRMTGIAPSREVVEDEWLPRARAVFAHYSAAGAPRLDADDAEASWITGRLGDVVVGGTPDDCIDGIRRWHEATRCEWFWPSMATRDPIRYREALTLFGREVIPAFRS